MSFRTSELAVNKQSPSRLKPLPQALHADEEPVSSQPISPTDSSLASSLVEGAQSESHRSLFSARQRQTSVSVQDLRSIANEFLMDCQYRNLRIETIRGYENILGHLFWFLQQQGFGMCGSLELKKLLCYIQEHHPEGRWGKKHLPRPVSPRTAKDYHIVLSRL